jgi:hypothetical protein
MSNYVLLNAVAGTSFCSLQDVKNLPEPRRLQKGVRIAPWPHDVRFHMDPNFPKQQQLPDVVKNLLGGIVVSKRLKELLAAQQPASVDYLPMAIVDHKGAVASADYFIVDAYEHQDCIDQQASILKWNAIDPTLISICKKLVIDESKIAAGATIFRLKHFWQKVLVARALADMIKAANMSGFKFEEIK